MESSKYHILQYECVSVHRVYHTFFQETQTRNIKLHKKHLQTDPHPLWYVSVGLCTRYNSDTCSLTDTMHAFKPCQNTRTAIT